jgi:hypothetical protein
MKLGAAVKVLNISMTALGRSRPGCGQNENDARQNG